MGQRVVVRFDHWDESSRHPSGHYVRLLGSVNEVDTEVAAILVEHQIATLPFSSGMLDTLPSVPSGERWQPDPAEVSRRRDLRSQRIFSIDPLGCQDIDDALSIRQYTVKGEIRYEVGVHIADVTHFVKHDSLLDLEARSRGTTVYLADRREDMLPALLSETLCSLREKEPRYAVSVMWTLDEAMRVLDTWFGRTVICSCHELHYGLAQALFDGTPFQQLSAQDRARVGDAAEARQLREEITLLVQVARRLRAQHLEKGALELASTEIRFELHEPGPAVVPDLASNGSSKQQSKGRRAASSKDSATGGTPSKVIAKQELEIMRVVAEYMIMANQAVAEQIYKHYPECSLLRRHPAPREADFRPLIECAAAKGFKIEVHSNRALARSLDQAVLLENPEFNHVLRTLATRAMSEAQYFCTGDFEPDQFYHYGLAADYYTHFTSPIRRYADVVAHRLLIQSLERILPPPLFPHRVTTELSDHINACNRNAKHAQYSSSEFFLTLYFRSRPNETAEGVIYAMKKNGFLVFVPKYGLKGAVFLRDRSGQLQIPEKAFAARLASRTSSTVRVQDFKHDTSLQQMVFQMSDASSCRLSLFDRIVVRITVGDSQYRIPPIRLELSRVCEEHSRSHRPDVLVVPTKEAIREHQSTIGSSLVRDPFGGPLTQQEALEMKKYGQSTTKQSLYSLFEEFSSHAL
mmetsp:Transcript_15599/g.39885  ORF Transcript_15599/g.39885 Transcript_15599/m.39885 type:complete len:692 (+) Transcript_15599:3-2078(+)